MGVRTVHGAIMLPLCNVSLSEGGWLEWLRGQFKGPGNSGVEIWDQGLEPPFATKAAVSAVSMRLFDSQQRVPVLFMEVNIASEQCFPPEKWRWTNMAGSFPFPLLSHSKSC